MKRAIRLRDQVLTTWNPPLLRSNQCVADIAQTSVMLTLKWCYPHILDDVELTENQEQALRKSMEVLERILDSNRLDKDHARQRTRDTRID